MRKLLRERESFSQRNVESHLRFKFQKIFRFETRDRANIFESTSTLFDLHSTSFLKIVRKSYEYIIKKIQITSFKYIFYLLIHINVKYNLQESPINLINVENFLLRLMFARLQDLRHYFFGFNLKRVLISKKHFLEFPFKKLQPSGGPARGYKLPTMWHTRNGDRGPFGAGRQSRFLRIIHVVPVLKVRTRRK